MDTFTKAHIFLYYIKEGEAYRTSVDSEVICVKRTKKKIILSNGVVVHIKKRHGNEYFHSASVVRKHKRYEYVMQILRDIEDYLIYQIQTGHENIPALSRF